MIQPLFGACSSGWFRKNTNRPPGSSTRAISAIAGSWSAMCSNTRQTTTASNAPSRNGKRVGVRARVRRHRRRARARPRSCAIVGSTPTTSGAPSRADEPRDLALTRPDVEHALRAGQALLREREDLLLVLGVGAVGEARPATSRRCVPRDRSSSGIGARSARDAEERREVTPGVALGHLRHLLGRTLGDHRARRPTRPRDRGRRSSRPT